MKNLLYSLNEFDSLLSEAGRMLIVADFDGALCPIAATPSSAAVDSTMLFALRRLETLSGITMAVISGRELPDLRARLPFLTHLAGNHGLEIETGVFEFAHPAALAAAPELERACNHLKRAIVGCRRAWVEHKRLSATLHYRQVEPALHRDLLRTARSALSPFLDRFSLRAGNLALEIRPRITWHQGYAVQLIRERCDADVVLCLGGDQTGESMFSANERGPNIYVGCSDRGGAAYRARNPAEVAVFLSHVYDVVVAAPRLRAVPA